MQKYEEEFASGKHVICTQ